MNAPDHDEDVVERMHTSASRLLNGRETVTDLDIADDSGLELPTVRAILSEESGTGFEVQQGADDEPWQVRAVAAP